MPKENVFLFAFNRGLVSPLALGRTDLERLQLSAETYTNWRPRALGSMMLRPGSSYLGSTASDNTARFIPFVFSTDDTALIELTNLVCRVWVSDALVTRSAVTAAVANGSFDSDLTSWTDSDESGATSAWVTGGYLGLTGDGTNAAIRRQQVTVNEANTEHALSIVIERGPVTFRCGSAAGTDSYITETVLDTGYHSLAFTPTGDFHLQFSSRHKRQTLVDSCTVESSGAMTIVTPFTGNDLSDIRYDQSGDIIFIAWSGQQYKIERRSTTSWSVVKYYADDGPYRPINLTETTISPSALSGNVTLTASTNIFKSTNVGSLFRITSDGQVVTSAISSDDTFTNTIRVTGVGTSRVFTIARSGIWSGTVTLQRSLTADTGPWEDVTTYTTNGTVSYDDSLDNQIAWYRIGVKANEFTSATITNITQANPGVVTTSAAHGFTTGEVVGLADVVGMTEVNGNSYTITVLSSTTFDIGVDTTGFTAYSSGGTAVSEGPITLTLDYPLGSIDGVCRITAYASEQSVSAEVIVDFGSITASENWNEGEWSDRRGWPTSISLVEGRIAWAGKDKINLSASDTLDSFDEEIVGDSAPISRSIGSGPVDTINWLVSLRRLLMGAEGAEFVCRSNGDDEPLTASNFNIKSFSTQGSNNVQAVKVDNNALFVQRGGVRLFEIAFGENAEYTSRDLTAIYPEIGGVGFTRIAVQRQPDTRIHCVRSDGTVAILIYDQNENVLCWTEYTTDGQVEDAVVLPGATGDGEDAVYYVVRRTINLATVRFLEKMALESQCQGDTVNRQADAHLVISQASSTTVSGLSHLEGESVVLWAGGKDLGTYTVSSGAITASEAVTSGCVGLGYTAQWKSTKLAYAAGLGTAMLQKKRVRKLGLMLYNTHYQGVTYGPDFNTLDNLPLMKDENETSADTVHSTFDEEAFFFNGNWDSDSRVCLEATAPKPCTILGAVMSVETHDKY